MSGASRSRSASVSGMAGWEVSRHPEWDMMYESGLTVREIADRCQRKRNTVHRHLQAREHYQPGLRARHEAALAARDPDHPTTGWRRRLTEAEVFFTAHGRLPNSGGDQAEKSLHSWMSGQRRAYHRGDLSTPKMVLLSGLTDWNTATPQMNLDQHWYTRFCQLQEYFDTTGQLPRYRNHETALEHTLGVWLHTQHQKRAEETLQTWRRVALDTALPGWRSRM